MLAWIVAIGLAIGIGAAAAQTGDVDETVGVAPPALRLELSPPQRSAILSAVQPETKQKQPREQLHLSVGASVPSSTELHALPAPALAEAPSAKGFKYTLVQNQVVLVDPDTLRVVDVIDR